MELPKSQRTEWDADNEADEESKAESRPNDQSRRSEAPSMISRTLRSEDLDPFIQELLDE